MHTHRQVASASALLPLCNPALGLSIEEKDLLFCIRIGRWLLPLPSYLCNPANALGLSIEEKDLLFCIRIGRWPLPLPSYLCNWPLNRRE